MARKQETLINQFRFDTARALRDRGLKSLTFTFEGRKMSFPVEALTTICYSPRIRSMVISFMDPDWEDAYHEAYQIKRIQNLKWQQGPLKTPPTAAVVSAIRVLRKAQSR